jgi:cell wall-associated NlpC family hydrolase
MRSHPYIPFCLYRSVSTGLSIFIAAVLLTGCASNPKPELQRSEQTVENPKAMTYPVPVAPTHPVIQIANRLKGRPYRYGGVTPRGFDCSGFVHYTYRKAGIPIPRTTQAQYLAAQRVTVDQARPGDLLFFSVDSKKLSHVGLYAGNGQFIHASTSRKRVIDASLDDPYWRKRLIAVGQMQ